MQGKWCGVRIGGDRAERRVLDTTDVRPVRTDAITYYVKRQTKVGIGFRYSRKKRKR